MLCRISILSTIAGFFAAIISTIGGILRQFTYKDAIDIILMAVIIYAAVKLVRETRAAQLMRGIVVLILAYFVSYELNLFMMTTLFSYFFQFAFIALMIIFQPEIRSALEKMGRSKVGRRLIVGGILGRPREKDKNILNLRYAIDAVAATCAQFQRDKVGALIVFERETKLGEVIVTGTIINAEPSVQLIGNIFFNKAPLHDGAMIIRGGSVYAAGCILPLTHRDDVNYELGTRHRAAIGLSENSDAVIVIVSEETGQISIACEGSFERNYTKDTLTEKLEKLLIRNSDIEDKRAGRRIKNEKK